MKAPPVPSSLGENLCVLRVLVDGAGEWSSLPDLEEEGLEGGVLSPEASPLGR